ncbi:hypothetical protein BYT27DRAFT_6685730 [Phlegmacium glaucopus]|nr:hypothetical protein BYT27DRAFT_6685730 [Phlegmacium glaucopus]
MSRVTRSQTAAVVANSQQATSQEEMVDINWVFFDKSHPEKCRPRPIEVPRSLFDAKSLNCQNLFANELMKKFNFKAIEDNIEFRKPKETLLSETASEDGWPESIKNIKISFRFIPYTSSFAKALDVDNEDAVHLIVTSEGSYQRRHVVPEAEAVATLKQTNAALYQCLELKIQTARRWTENDVRSNGGIFMRENEQPSTPTPREILDLETKLRGKRSFNTPDDDRDLSIARHYKDHFESTYIRTTEDHASVKSSMEFIAFYVLLRCFHEDASRYKTEESSSLKAHGLKGYLIVPPFFSGQKDCDVLLYRDETHWTFPLFLSCPTMSQLPRQYTPVSDFSVWFGKLDLPLIVAEVVSQKNEEDRYRMLLQAIALARLVFQLRRSESTAHPFIVGIYLTASLNAERYIVMSLFFLTRFIYPRRILILPIKMTLSSSNARCTTSHPSLKPLSVNWRSTSAVN